MEHAASEHGRRRSVKLRAARIQTALAARDEDRELAHGGVALVVLEEAGLIQELVVQKVLDDRPVRVLLTPAEAVVGHPFQDRVQHSGLDEVLSRQSQTTV